jgi:hypothetical protein
MSTLSTYSKKTVAEDRTLRKNEVENFMGGTSFQMTPLVRLRIIAASSIFGEPQYYRDGIKAKKTLFVGEHEIFADLYSSTESAADVFTKAIDAALDYDFRSTLELAKELRTSYNMRLNPAVIFIRASLHPDRQAFNAENPGLMKSIGKEIAGRPDDLTNQFNYYMYLKSSKAGLPSLIKRTWAERLTEYSRYQLNKYKGKSLIDLVRISHANSEDINELMKTGKLAVAETEQTWESLRSAGKTWAEILQTIKMPHMALLRNLRGILSEVKDLETIKQVAEHLKSGVRNGKQFPFRYYSAQKAVYSSENEYKSLLTDALEECMDIAIENTPALKGRVACLSDNSGSAWRTCTSEYGNVQIAEIANLSSIITASRADYGVVGVFGDELSMKPVSKRSGLLGQLSETSKRGQQQGQCTENGIWLFWEQAIREKQHWDTVFIYSDMQAGHGGLYGINSSEYNLFRHKGTKNIDVLALVQKYRQDVNPKVNVFSVQVAGYDNSVLPENLYRGAVLTGWTGRESAFAAAVIEAWDKSEQPK